MTATCSLAERTAVQKCAHWLFMADSHAVEPHAGTSSEGLRKRPTSVSGSTATGRAQNNEQREMDDTDVPKEAPLGKTPDGKSEYSMFCVRTCHFSERHGLCAEIGGLRLAPLCSLRHSSDTQHALFAFRSSPSKICERRVLRDCARARCH